MNWIRRHKKYLIKTEDCVSWWQELITFNQVIKGLFSNQQTTFSIKIVCFASVYSLLIVDFRATMRGQIDQSALGQKWRGGPGKEDKNTVARSMIPHRISNRTNHLSTGYVEKYAPYCQRVGTRCIVFLALCNCFCYLGCRTPESQIIENMWIVYLCARFFREYLTNWLQISRQCVSLLQTDLIKF